MSLIGRSRSSGDDPAARAPASGAGLRPVARAAASAPSILVVDDDESIRDMLASVLRASGYSVRVAEDGHAALDAIAHEVPSLILLDLRMPRVDGWALAERLRERGMNVPIVVMSAAREAERAAREIGARSYLAKPFEIEELLTEVARHVAGPGN